MRLLPLLAIVAAGAACHDSAIVALDPVVLVPRDSSAAFQTDSLKYTLRSGISGYEVTIGFTFRNLTRNTVYFINCHGLPVYSLEKYEGNNWVAAYTGTFSGA